MEGFRLANLTQKSMDLEEQPKSYSFHHTQAQSWYCTPKAEKVKWPKWKLGSANKQPKKQQEFGATTDAGLPTLNCFILTGMETSVSANVVHAVWADVPNFSA